MKRALDPGRRATPPSATPLLQRRCACGGRIPGGGACDACKRTRQPLMTRLVVGAAGDRFEQEAEQMAERVAAGPADAPLLHAPPRIPRLHTPGTREAVVGPASVDRALSSPGQALDRGLRSQLEPHFGHDLSAVRVHTGASADDSARELNAEAYAVGHDIVFGTGRYAPHTPAGRHLLAHELTHVVQQTGGQSSPGGRLLQRTLRVNPSHPLSARPTDRGAGRVVPTSAFTPAQLAAGSKSTGCCCLQVLAASAHDWTIEVSELIGARTVPSLHQVYLNPAGSPIEYGSFTAAGSLAFQGDVTTAGHELCGHAALEEIGAHPAGNQDRSRTDVHDPTVNIENAISTEQGVAASDLRGLAGSGPHRGESTDRITIGGFAFNAFTPPPAASAMLDFAAGYIVTNSSFVSIVGHSDNMGSAPAKQAASEQRAFAVKQALHFRGVSATVAFQGSPMNRFPHVRGVADTEPPSGALAADPARWRRVEILTASYPAGALTHPAGTPVGVRAHVRAPGLPAARSSPDDCVRRLARGAYP